MKKIFTHLILLSILVIAGCSSTRHVQAISNEIGIASWYGNQFAHRTTASGETYLPHLLTAAHPTLPFNTLVKVTNVDNNESVVVRINDRGPFIKGRIIDLSYESAKRIHMIGKGIARVKLEIVNKQ